MARKQKYASYDPRIKALISRTGRADLFPHLKIPRTTALYWIRQGFDIDDPVLGSLAQTITEMADKISETETLLRESRASLQLLKQVHKIMGHQLGFKHIDSKEIRDKVLRAIRVAMASARRSICLRTLDMSLSRFKRWKREKRGCAVSDAKTCPKFSPNQLTFREIQLMGEFVTSEKYAHFPIRSLQLYAQRMGLLFCTYSTWTKYISLYGWLRPRKKKRKKCTRVGIRATRPNQIWHVDVSHFIFPNGQKAFIQAVIDNFSRYVLAWQVLSSYDGATTAALLEQALKRSTRTKLCLLVDGGSENKGPGVQELELEGAFTKKVARFEISYSNSMVEALFRQLKNNYLYSQKIDSIKSLFKHAKFWFGEHNDVIPHTAFDGETPLERFKQSWDKDEEIRILVRHEEAIKLRINHNQQVFCKLCEVA